MRVVDFITDDIIPNKNKPLLAIKSYTFDIEKQKEKELCLFDTNKKSLASVDIDKDDKKYEEFASRKFLKNGIFKELDKEKEKLFKKL